MAQYITLVYCGNRKFLWRYLRYVTEQTDFNLFTARPEKYNT